MQEDSEPQGDAWADEYLEEPPKGSSKELLFLAIALSFVFVVLIWFQVATTVTAPELSQRFQEDCAKAGGVYSTNTAPPVTPSDPSIGDDFLGAPFAVNHVCEVDGEEIASMRG